MLNNFVRLSEVGEKVDLPIKKSTLYKYHCLGIYPEIFVNFSKRVIFVDIEKLKELLERKRGRKG